MAKIELKHFQDFRRELKRHNIDEIELLKCYSNNRDDWTPFLLSKNNTIQNTLINLIKRKKLKYTPIPYSEEFFRGEIHPYLLQGNCIVVIDAVSLYHPKLRHKFIQSQIGGNLRAVFLVLSPVHIENKNNQLIYNKSQQHLELIYNRFHTQLDFRCELNIGDINSFQRKLFSIFNQDIEKPSPNPETIEEFWKETNVSKPQGMYRV